MNTSSMIHQAHLNEWAIRLADQKSSGLHVSQWCEQNGYSTHQFFYWKRLLKDQAASKLLPEIVQVSLPAATDLSDTLLQVPSQVTQVADTSFASYTSCTSARIIINNIPIELSSSASEDFIRTLIKAVRNV